ncbi:MAG: NDP-sugar synthase [Gammaproteobacteria bacterium]|nr:NDP-sugar synthase [Gammaproteobacteria bacterium]
MQAVVFADRNGFKDKSLHHDQSPALLPIAGRPTVIHCIEDLADAGLKKLLVVIATDAHKIESLLGNGMRWGVDIEYMLAKGEEPPSQVIRRCGKLLATPFLMVRGDMLRSPAVNDFLMKSEFFDTGNLQGFIKSRLAGIALIRDSRDQSTVDNLHWHNIRQVAEPLLQHVTIDNADICYLSDNNDFFTTSLATTNGGFANVYHSGIAIKAGVVHGRNLDMHKTVTVNGSLSCGSNVSIGANVNIRGTVVLGNAVMIDNNACLQDCVILAETYIGPGVNIEHALVNANYIKRIDNGTIVRIEDDCLVSSQSTPIAPFFDRLLALILLFISFPLWLAAAVIAGLSNPGHACIARNYKSNLLVTNDRDELVPATFKLLEWNTAIPLLRHLPRILAVINGNLRLIGATPTEFIDGKTDIPQFGLISTALVELPLQASPTEQQIHELVYDKKRKTSSDIKYAFASFRCLFRPQTWLRR